MRDGTKFGAETTASEVAEGIAFVALYRPRWMPQLLIIATKAMPGIAIDATISTKIDQSCGRRNACMPANDPMICSRS